ncbi:MAG: amidohydrolase family protein [Acidimicrobiales bacterium]
MWETDFPHPTCLYPDSGSRASEKLAQLSPEVQRKVLHDNAAELYKITD